ncbi:hypothetical protein [Nodosilinea sp. P-1105]|uniref:hypothetical protein n=1 Tax=Nodosilinea sp. P-1105 TaxID=2546229 RepID=UPI00146E4245|nr:hypothetical protein [Nodosilinea sp. P-1105]NMF85152.1 hypothetical protein [Nodosilinea sp. P-1105]
MAIASLSFPVFLDTAVIAGTALWALALYLGFSPLAQWTIDRVDGWLHRVESSLSGSQDQEAENRPETEVERTGEGREAQTAALASLVSVVPFLLVGGLIYYGLTISLGASWAVSLGLISCVGCGVYELGRQAGQASD